MITSDFSNLIELKLPQLLKLADELNLGLRFVGGVTRDFKLFNKLATDIDIEVYFQNQQSFEANWQELTSTLVRHYKLDEKPFNILSFKLSSFDVELSPVRTEEFLDKKNHKNFIASFYSYLDSAISFKRRDFTFNAIGIVYENCSWKLDDPFNGINDIEQKLMNYCDKGLFKLDPVRFLRAYRFKTAFNFEFTEALDAELKLIDLSELSVKHFIYELNKSQDYKYFLNHCLSNFSFLHWVRELGIHEAIDARFENINKYIKALTLIERPIDFSLFICFNCDIDKVLVYFQHSRPIIEALLKLDSLIEIIQNNTQLVFQYDSFSELIEDQGFINMHEAFGVFSKNRWMTLFIDDVNLKSLVEDFYNYNISTETLTCEVTQRKFLKLYKFIMDRA